MAEIFLMEDNGPLRRVLSFQLRDAGYNVTSFENGAASEDMELFAAADVLVTDMAMPKVDGETVLNNVRDRFPDLPVIVISGAAQARLDAVEAFAKLRKPFNEVQLIDTVQSALNKHNRGPRTRAA